MTPEQAANKKLRVRVPEDGYSRSETVTIDLKTAYDLFNEGRGIDAGNGWCGWNPFNPDAEKKVCDCGSTNEKSDKWGITCWVPSDYGERYAYDLRIELNGMV